MTRRSSTTEEVDPAGLQEVEEAVAMTEPPMPLVTSRYRSYQPEWGVAVRITVGNPRFVRYPMEQALSLAPYELFKPPYKGIDDIPTEMWVYNKRLVAYEAKILEELEAIAGRHPGKTAVLMCYEDVVAGEACHRRWAADWFKRRFGWDVPEVGLATDPESLVNTTNPDIDPEATLF